LARLIQSTSPHPTSPRSILILSTHICLGLSSGLFPSGFPTNNLYAFFFYAIERYIVQLVQANGAFVTLSFSSDCGPRVSYVVVIPDMAVFYLSMMGFV
jgi:hypothetical protein